MALTRIALQQIWKLAKKGDDERIAVQMPVPGTRSETGIEYLGDAEPMHRLNLYYPAAFDPAKDALLPTIIDIHGGGLMYGDKELNRRYCEYLASQGFCVMGMSYRLLPKTDLRGMVQDVFASIHWLEQFGPMRGCDLCRVLLTGDSAGGHLTSLVLCIQQSPTLQQKYGVAPFGFSFAAAAISNGVCEMHDYYSFVGKLSATVDREMHKMLLGKAGEKAAWNHAMSFSEVVAQASGLPPILVIGSENDPFYQQTQWLLENLSKHKLAYETLIWKKEDGPHLGHVFQISHWEWPESKRTNDKMIQFFREMM